ncbi:hypothetical protein EC968_010576 [Mortierella alpina]|nr:hypothetical protein EC968_010576 [Mortierella alpina]
MSFDSSFNYDGSTLPPEIDEILEAVLNEQSMILDEDSFEEMFFPVPSPFKLYAFPQAMVLSRQTVVEQDEQGIRWRDGEKGKEKYRQARDRTYPSNTNAFYPDRPPLKECRETLDYSHNEFYRFRYTDTSYHCSHRHPQLRHLVCATSKNDVYYLYNNAVQQWNPHLQESRTILGQPLKRAHAVVPNKITTMAAMDEYLLVGGEDGSFTFMNLQTCHGPIFDTFTHGEVNGVEMSHSRTGGPHAFISTNDFFIRCVDLRTLQTPVKYPTDWFVNYTSQSPDGHMIGIVGDDVDGQVMSINSREKIATLTGHQRYSFSVAWSPDSRMLATGSDDRSTCIYDTRKMSHPVHILSKDVLESVRSLRYSSCGRYLFMAEDRNFVHVVDASSDYTKAQRIDFIGDISGISPTPDGEGLYVGVSSVEFSSILEFEKSHCDYEMYF